jgi:hypothetical protein
MRRMVSHSDSETFATLLLIGGHVAATTTSQA